MKDRKRILWTAGIALLAVVLVVWLIGRGKPMQQEAIREGQAPRQIAPPEKPNIQDSQVAIEQSRTRIDLRDVEGGDRRGTATRSSDGKTFLFTLSAQLPDPGAGRYYEGWVMSSRESPAEVSVGKLFQADPGIYALVYSSQQSLYGYERVVVTLEAVDDGHPETRILEGSF